MAHPQHVVASLYVPMTYFFWEVPPAALSFDLATCGASSFLLLRRSRLIWLAGLPATRSLFISVVSSWPRGGGFCICFTCGARVRSLLSLACSALVPLFHSSQSIR